MSFVAQSFNALFRLRADGGGDYLLRVGPALRVHPPGSEEIEADWLDALRRETRLPVAEVIRTIDGEVVSLVADPGVPEPRSCVLFTWVPGRTLSIRLDLATAERSGRLLAELHSHARAWLPGPGAAVPVADRLLYWSVPSQLGSVPRHGTLFLDAADRAQVTIDSLWSAPSHPARLLHGDLTPVNIVETRRGLAPIDFQDLVWGFDLQDVAVSLLPYQRYEAAALLTERFKAGYADVRAWPEHDDETLDALFAARRLHMLNLALNMRPAGLDAYTDQVAARLARWMNC
jgi:Ser/Thr protein kinase RdoA (MazF antagonist)